VKVADLPGARCADRFRNAVTGEKEAPGVPGSRRYLIRTYGCQMNVHDSEKVSNLLLHHGYEAADALDDADLLIINTCSIRDKAEHKLYSDLGLLREWKAARSGRALGVAGCVAQQEGDRILRRFDQVDFVFGTHNLRLVPAMAEAAARGSRSIRIDESSSLERFDLPERHPGYRGTTPGRAFVTVMEGCDMFCSFCVVPHTRGREISRPASSILAEVRDLVEHGVTELTLLGQTVNAYGRHAVRRGQEATQGTMPFAELLRALDAIPGLRRIRYTSPHPTFFDAALIRAHGELESLCPHVHLPLQSGSDAVLERMRRRHDAASYRGLVTALRESRSDLAITTDVIVGFPGETDRDFEDTLGLVEELRFVDGFSFKYSPRPNTPAAELANAVAPEESQARLERLQTLQRSLTLAYHRKRVGDITEIMVEGSGRRPGQRSGHDPYHRTVNYAGSLDDEVRPGDWVTTRIVEATPHSLIGERLGSPLTPRQGSADEFSRSADTTPR
jgi:tRNA-2-methylthio-N6-dimethylallyladenosine synthase